MNGELNIIERVMAAQNDTDAADDLIREYFPFIKSETAKSIGRIPIEGKDDELSVALMGFHEAVESYNPEKGAFIPFAAVVIKRRIIDFLRHEDRFKRETSYDMVPENNDISGVEDNSGDVIVDRETVKAEILQLSKDLKRLDITISDVSKNCPKQKKTIDSCREVINYICGRPEFMEELFNKGKLPVKQLLKETSVKKKTLERHRKYLIALTFVYFRGYDSMIEHLSEVFKTKKGGK